MTSGPRLDIKHRLVSIGISATKIRRCHHHLILIVVIIIPRIMVYWDRAQVVIFWSNVIPVPFACEIRYSWQFILRTQITQGASFTAWMCLLPDTRNCGLRMRRECRERFPRHRRLAMPTCGTCVTHVPWCMPASLTSGFLWSRWRGKRSRHSRRMHNRQFGASDKRPMGQVMVVTSMQNSGM